MTTNKFWGGGEETESETPARDREFQKPSKATTEVLERLLHDARCYGTSYEYVYLQACSEALVSELSWSEWISVL